MSQAISLYEVFGQVPDPRDSSGRRLPLQAILTLTSVAINLLNRLGVNNKTALRRHAAHPEETMPLVKPDG